MYQRPGNIAEQYAEEEFNDEDDGEESGDGLYTESDHSTGIELSNQKQPAASLVHFQPMPSPQSSSNGAVMPTTDHVDVRDRSFSDGGHKADDEYDSDLDLL